MVLVTRHQSFSASVMTHYLYTTVYSVIFAKTILLRKSITMKMSGFQQQIIKLRSYPYLAVQKQEYFERVQMCGNVSTLELSPGLSQRNSQSVTSPDSETFDDSLFGRNY